jgi:surfeit locus 1 family protein
VRGAEPPAQADALRGADPDALVYRRVSVSGTYETEREVLLAARTLDGRAGHHVLTPLRTEDGLLVVVDRGWVPLEESDPPVAAAAPPSGVVEVDGLLLPSEPARRAGAFGDGSGLEFVSAVDLDRLGGWLGEPLAPLSVRLQDQRPGNAGALPVPAPLPETNEGNHLSYAIQWFLFAGVVAVGFPLLVRRTARDRGVEKDRQDARLQEPAGT